MKNRIVVLFVVLLVFSVLPFTFAKASSGDVEEMMSFVSNRLQERVANFEASFPEWIFSETDYIFTKTDTASVCQTGNTPYVDAANNSDEFPSEACTNYSTYTDEANCVHCIYATYYDDHSQEISYGDVDENGNCLILHTTFVPGW
jgi:hypothetical protein